MKTHEELEAENARLTKEYQNSDQDNMRLQQALDAERGQSNARLQKWQRSEKENARLRDWLRVVAFHAVKARMKDGTCPWHGDNCMVVLQSWAEGALNGERLDPKLVEGLPDPKV